MVFESIAGGLVKAALPKVAGAIAVAVKNKLHPTELQRSLEVGLRESGAFDRGQKVNNAAFYHCTDKDADTFLATLLDHPEVQRELQKPLEQDGAPDVAILVQTAKHVAVAQALSIPDEPLEIWLTTFANAYFNAITAIRFQVAKADYLEQLVNWFDDLKFLGVALDRHEETSKQLAQIFVMPDVEEEARRGWGGEGLRGWGDEGVTDDRQSQLLQQQRLRSQLERSGRKFSARQLLNQHQKKVVLLGAPGSGKTTLMGFFAVTLAERQGAIAPTSDNPTEGIDAPTEGTDRNPTQMQRNRSQIDRHAEGSDYDRSQIERQTEGFDRDRSQMQHDRLAMYPDTEGLQLDPLALQTDADALPLPILIRIRDWARTPDVTIPEYARQFAETTMSCKPLPKGFFEHWLNNGKALILLDGLDEVAEEAKRYHLVQCIENFLGQYPLNRAIITSRPAGYKRDFFRTEEFPHYELQPFDDGKIEEFCDRWYRSRVQDTAEAQRRRESLQKALNQQDRIKLLARNPLLLTIIALIHRYQTRLPRERYKLYDKAVETLLTSWDDNKELSNQTVLQYLQLDDLRRLMESLAYWIHTQGSTGDREGGTLIDKDELIQKLCQEIKTLKQLQHYEAKAEAERFVKFIRDRTGLLNEQGQDCYAFVHKTFQEYLAAQDISYQADNEDNFEIVLTHIEQHLHDPHWREVLLLLIAQQSPKKAARAIRKVLTANSPYEQWLHRDLLFAGRCLAEDIKGLQGADQHLASEVLAELIELEVNASKRISGSVRWNVFSVLSSLNETAYESQILQQLKTAAVNIDSERLREYQVALGETEAVIESLWEQFENEESSTRSKAAISLGNLGHYSEEVEQKLLALFRDKDSGMRSNAAHALRRNKSNAVLQALLSLLQDEDSSVRYNAVRALNKSENISEAIVVQALLERLQDEDVDVRHHVIATFSNLENAPEAVIQTLLAQLQDNNAIIYSSASISLNLLGNISEPVVGGLLKSLQNEESVLRSLAALALFKLGKAPDGLMPHLIALLEDEHSGARFRAARALGKLGKRSHQVEPAIVQWMEQHQDEDCVGAGIDALWEMVEGEG